MFRRLGFFIALLFWFVVVLWPGYYGWEYYMTPLQERPFMELHQLLKPTGLIGHGYGIVGSLFMFIGVSTYSIRKRFMFFQNLGRLRTWLTFHIFLCTSGPILVLWHTSFKISGLVAISFWSMIVVVSSGVLGRYVYNRIPKTEEGYFKTVEFILSEQSKLKHKIESYIQLTDQQEAELGLHTATLKFSSPWMALYTAIMFDINGLFRWNKDQRFLKTLQIGSSETNDLLGLIKSYRWKTRQQFLIEPLQKIFGYWHVFHIPLATIMFIILGIHVAIAILFGYTWMF